MSRHRSRRDMPWSAGLVVAVGAGAATAHGLYEVATAAGAPAAIAWLYPLITDGLALVAYAVGARLTGRAHTQAWTVVVLAAALSGLAQATYLAGAVGSAPVALRFGVGAWPAIAAAIVAHLLHLLARTAPGDAPAPTGRGTAAPLPGSGPVRRTAAPVAQPKPVAPDVAVATTAAPPGPAPIARTARPGTAPAGERVAPAATGSPPTGTTRSQSRSARSDAELLAVLAARSAPISVRAAARELGCGFNRARRLVTQAGLLPATKQRSEPAAHQPPETTDRIAETSANQ